MSEEPIKQNIKASLDAVANAIDVKTQVRLNEIRHQAVIQKPVRRNWIPMTGLAATLALAVVLVWQFNQPLGDAVGQDDWLSDIDMLAAEDDTEFYEDLEFLTWLEENQLLESDI